MSPFNGKYMYEFSENLEEYLKTIGGAEYAEAAMAFIKKNPVFDWFEKEDEPEVWVTITTTEGQQIHNRFKLGEPYDDVLPHGGFYTSLPEKKCAKSITTLDGNIFSTVTELPNGNRSFRVHECTSSGIIGRLTDEKTGVKAYRYYKKL